jgi:hypothetical protein
MRIVLVLVFCLFLSGCGSTQFQKFNLSSLGKNFWNNPEISNLSSPKFQLEFSKVKGHCKVESFKLQVPSPSCVQPPKQDCSGQTGFSKGLCQSYIPPMKCDYSSVNAAKEAQGEIFHNCMLSKGWSQHWKKGIGTDISGGLFEKVAITGNDEYFIKMGTVTKYGSIYSAIVRKVSLVNSDKSSQFVYKFNQQTNLLEVENAKGVPIQVGSAGDLLFKRVKQLL